MGRFFRLVVAEQHPRSGRLSGVFVAAYRLRRAGVLPWFERVALDHLLTWFGEHLPVPRPMRDAAICWFKGTANPCSQRVWDLA